MQSVAAQSVLGGLHAFLNKIHGVVAERLQIGQNMHIDDVRRLHPAQCFVLPLPAASGVIGGQAFAVVLPHGVQVGIKLFGPCDRSERIAVVSPEDDRRLFPNPSLPHALLDRRDDRLDEPFGLVVVTAEGFTQANHESNVGKRFDEFNNRFGGVIGHQRVNPCLALFQAVLYGKGVRNVDIVEFEHNPNPPAVAFLRQPAEHGAVELVLLFRDFQRFGVLFELDQ